MSAPIKLALCGDLMLGRLVNENIPRLSHTYPWGDMLPLLTAADLFLINQEFALTSHPARWREGAKAFYFRAGPEVVTTLTTAGVSFASLANNHIPDYEMVGLLDMVAVLDRAGIAYAGVGSNEATARAPVVIDCMGLRIGIVSFADHPPEWAATSDQPGLNYTPISVHPSKFARVEAAIKAARDAADSVRS